MKKILISVCLAVATMAVSGPASAQSRPLSTEDAETVPAGNILLEAGFDLSRAAVYPVSGLTGNLRRIGTFGLSFGVSSVAEIQIDGGLRNQLAITRRDIQAPLAGLLDVPGESTSDIEDIRVGAKVRFLSETASRPSMAVRFFTRLPNAGNESGLGLDTTDFHVGFALAKTVESIRVVGNVGIGVLTNPAVTGEQNDVIEFGASVARAVRPGVELVGELNGRRSTHEGGAPAGTESLASVRLGARLTRGPVRLDGGFLLGITDYDPSWGITTGVTWVFRAFDVQ